MNVTSRQLKAFLLTARHQSFSRAAEELFITQSGMSLLVRELETQLGFRLLHRTTRRVSLTEAGTRFFPVAERSLSALESAATSIGRAAGDARPRLSVGATPLIAAELLAPAVAQYRHANSRLDIQVHDMQGTRLIEMLQAGEIDVAVSDFMHDVAGADKMPLARFSLMLIRSQDHGPVLSPLVKWSDIAMRRLIGCSPDNSIQELVDERLLGAGRRHPPEIVCNYPGTQIAMVESGAGIAVMPSLALRACLKRKVVVHALVDPVVSGELFWIVNKGRPLHAAAGRFCVFLRDSVAEWSGRLPPAPAMAA
jgi:DNA-binding transcriptional LysR family regulator